MRRVLSLLLCSAALVLILFISCDNLFTSITTSYTPPITTPTTGTESSSDTDTVTLTGSIGDVFTQGGAVPTDFSESSTNLSVISRNVENELSRSAMPTKPTAGIIYTFTAESVEKAADGATPLKATTGSVTTDNGSEPVVSIPLFIGYKWKIIVTMKYNGNDILSDTYTMESALAASFTLSHDFVLKPLGTGNGNINLTMSVGSGVTADSITVSGLPGVAETFAPTDGIFTLSKTDVSGGVYNVKLDFKSGGNTIYSTIQAINVFPNMTTNKWLPGVSGSELSPINASGVFCVTSSLVQSFELTQIYVGENPSQMHEPSDINLGTPYAPLASLSAALERIQNTGDDTKDYKIYIAGTQTGNFVLDETLNDKANSITLCGMTGNSLDKLDADGDGTVLSVTTSVPVTVKKLTLTGGNVYISSGTSFFTDDNVIIIGTMSYSNGLVFVEGATISGAVADSLVFITGRTVQIGDLWVCDHEVTQAEYQTIMGTIPSYFDGSTGKEPANGEVQENRPVEMVSWYAAIAYCNKRSLAENLTPCYSVNGITDWENLAYSSIPTTDNATWNAATCNWTANGYRLPIEAEWEYAARGGNGLTGTQYTYSGSDTIDEVAWYSENSDGKTHEVKKLSPNNLEIFDMSGNVWEWCWDWYGDISDGTAAIGSVFSSYRVKRGGPYTDDTYNNAVYIRYGSSYLNQYDSIGFRVVRNASERKPVFYPTSYTELPEGTNGTAGTSWTYALFGDFPQTVKPSNVTVDETKSVNMGAYTYYFGNDGCWYAKSAENAYGEGYTYSNGSEVSQSGTSYKYFKVEPIKWRVLTTDYNETGNKLLLAERVLIKSMYYDDEETRTIDGNTIYPNNYEHSKVRAYLNGIPYNKQGTNNNEFSGKGFLQTAFTSNNQSLIATTNVDNSAESTWDTAGAICGDGYPCNNTSDKVFLLSEHEVTSSIYGFTKGESEQSARIRGLTDFAVANGALQNGYGYGFWRLRSPYGETNYNSWYVQCVYFDGTAYCYRCVDNDGPDNHHDTISYDCNSIVPALCLDN